MLKPIKIFLHKVSAGLAEHVCLSSLKGIKRLRSPLQFTHYSPWPVNGFVIMGCPLWIVSNCPLSRSKSLREYADCVRIILTIDNGWWRVITCLYCPRAHMRPHGAPSPAAGNPERRELRSATSRKSRYFSFEAFEPSADISFCYTALCNLCPPAEPNSSNLPASRMKHGAAGPAGARNLRAWAAAVIWRWEVAKQRSEKNDRERERTEKESTWDTGVLPWKMKAYWISCLRIWLRWEARLLVPSSQIRAHLFVCLSLCCFNEIDSHKPTLAPASFNRISTHNVLLITKTHRNMCTYCSSTSYCSFWLDSSYL